MIISLVTPTYSLNLSSSPSLLLADPRLKVRRLSDSNDGSVCVKFCEGSLEGCDFESQDSSVEQSP